MSFPPVTQIIAPLPLPVTLVGAAPYKFPGRAKSGATLVTQDLLVNGACMLDLVAGYNSDPTTTNLLFVQLHDTIVLNPGDLPEVVIPVYGGKTPYSFAVETEFFVGLTIALSTTELTFTAPATTWLAYNANFRTIT